ncbi:MAG: hypothetical protein WCC53_09315 [Thermoanaerobaculia bacterium]|jgi:hypothetical protein
MTRLARLAIILAAGLVAGGEARAQLTCTPAHLRAGAELRIQSPGAFGGSPSAEVSLAYRLTPSGAAVRFGSPRSWSVREVAFLLPADLGTGVYEVVLSSPAGALRNPSCFTVDPPIVAVTVARASAGVAPSASVFSVTSPDKPCLGNATLNITGMGFQPGTEVASYAVSHPPAGTLREVPSPGDSPLTPVWRRGITMLEATADGPYANDYWTNLIYTLRITGPTSMQATMPKCFVLEHGAKLRAWFPDGTKSAWVPFGP